MICPLRSHKFKGVYNQDQYEDLNCLKEECAWWAPIAKCCSVLNAACELWRIGDALEEMNKKMPLAGGFKK